MVFAFMFVFLFKVERGELKDGQLLYRQLSEIFSEVHYLWQGGSFKVVVPFCFECLIYRISQKGTF